MVGALCAYLEPVYDNKAPRQLATYGQFLLPLLTACTAQKTSFVAWLSDLEIALNRQSKPVLAVLVSDGQLRDDPQAKQIPALVTRLAKNPRLQRVWVFGLRTDGNQNRSAATFQNALNGFRAAGKFSFSTNTAWSEGLRELAQALK